MTQTEPFYQITKVAEILRITRPLVLRLVKEEGLQAVRTPTGLRIDPLVLAEWVEAQIASARLEGMGLVSGSPLGWHRKFATSSPGMLRAAA